jgi:hypothetical protein
MDASVVDLPLPVVPVTSVPLFSRQPPYHLRQVQILELGHPKRNETHDDGDRTPLPERVHPETTHPRDRVGEVRLPFLLKRLDDLPTSCP